MSPCRNPGCISTHAPIVKPVRLIGGEPGERVIVKFRFCSDTCYEEWFYDGPGGGYV